MPLTRIGRELQSHLDDGRSLAGGDYPVRVRAPPREKTHRDGTGSLVYEQIRRPPRRRSAIRPEARSSPN